MGIPYKLHIKLPDGREFNAEGPQAIVQKAFERFIAAAEKMATSSNVPRASEHSHPSPIKGGHRMGAIDATDLQRVYATDSKGKFVSLLLSPEGANKASDAALLLVYGHQHLLHMTPVPVTRLKKGLKQSAIPVDRVDRIMESMKHLVNKSGSRGVGNKYVLNNQGNLYVEDLLLRLINS